MRTKIITWAALFTIAMVSIASVLPVKKIKYSIKKIENSWYVVNEQNKPLPVEADRKDDIEWTAEGSDMIFQFPDKLSVLFTKEDGSSTGDSYYVEVKAGKKLKLKVKDNAPVGRYVYSVLVKKDGVFAEGSSPPVMIIK